MSTCSQYPQDPFLVSGERIVDHFILDNTLATVDKDGIEGIIPVPGPWGEESLPIGGTRNDNVAKSWSKGFYSRIAMATLGGFLLVGPMWLMVLNNTLYTCLVTTTAFVTVFGLLMAWFLEKPMEVMSATAAYAAVLVVFVGLSADDNAKS